MSLLDEIRETKRAFDSAEKDRPALVIFHSAAQMSNALRSVPCREPSPLASRLGMPLAVYDGPECIVWPVVANDPDKVVVVHGAENARLFKRGYFAWKEAQSLLKLNALEAKYFAEWVEAAASDSLGEGEKR